jgi:hypothetical protein
MAGAVGRSDPGAMRRSSRSRSITVVIPAPTCHRR